MKQSIMIAGVGGQGVLTAANILARAALHEGYNVVTSELHGMAQRGGDVECSIRIGDVFSPIIADETAEALISFEPLEALRNAHKIKKGGTILTDVNPIVPPLISIGLGSYTSLDTIFETLARERRLIKIDANAIAREAGSILTKNVVMLGAFYSLDILPLQKESIITVIRETIKEKYTDMNLKAFSLGEQTVKQKEIEHL